MADLNKCPDTVKELSDILLEIIERGDGDASLWFDSVCPMQLEFAKCSTTGKIKEVSFEKFYPKN